MESNENFEKIWGQSENKSAFKSGQPLQFSPQSAPFSLLPLLLLECATWPHFSLLSSVELFSQVTHGRCVCTSSCRQSATRIALKEPLAPETLEPSRSPPVDAPSPSGDTHGISRPTVFPSFI